MDDHIQKIMKFTNYSYDLSKQKLQEFNGNYEDVIKDYYNIKPKQYNIQNINQEIYKQIRKKIDISEYRNKNPIDIQKVQENFIQQNNK
uniref:Uncharacterized protein n=1 Tax=viral metagenome TaxID=1070528 RepID=A0A6C0H5N4_9ZZZZ